MRLSIGILIAFLIVIGCEGQEASNQAGGAAGLLEVPVNGLIIDPPAAKSRIPEKSWYCDMSEVHYARMEKGDGICPRCGMKLVQRKDGHQHVGPILDGYAPKHLTTSMRWNHLPMNTADLDTRAPSHKLGKYTSTTIDPSKKTGQTPLSEFVAEILLWPSTIRLFPFVISSSFKHMDYYNHRDEVQRLFEKRIATASSDQRPLFLENYAWTMLCAGEFKKIAEWFPAKLERIEKSPHYGAVVFAIAQANYRIGDYKVAIEQSKLAQDLLTDSPNETLWQLFMSELAAFGPDIYTKYSRDRYSLEYVPAWFPKTDWELPFEDVTASVGRELNRWGGYGSSGLMDLDGDGWDDLIHEHRSMTSFVYRNMQGKYFKRLPDVDLGLAAGAFMFPTDFNGDGIIDISHSCCDYEGIGPQVLLQGLGNMQFKDVSAEIGWDNEVYHGMVPAWIDYDLDGHLDMINGDWRGPSRLYHNQGDGTYERAEIRAGIKTPGKLGVEGELPEFGAHGSAWGYLVGDDRWPDLFTQGWGWRRLYQNNGNGTFTDVTEKAGIEHVTDSKSYLTVVFDFNNDGRDDILSGSYVVNEGELVGFSATCLCANLLRSGHSKRELGAAPTIFVNMGDGTFKDIRDKTRFIPLGAMGYSYGDWNNDGYQDLIFGLGGPYMQQAEPFLFYQNNGGDGTFTLMTPFVMQSLWGKGHGIAFSDYDHDGGLDVVLNSGGQLPGDLWPSLILHNTGTKNHSLAVRLKADPKSGTNTLAIGARVTVKTGASIRVQNVYSGSTFGQNSLTLHFGLGDNAAADEIVVEWPNKAMQRTVLKGVAADQAIEISQATGGYRQLYAHKT